MLIFFGDVFDSFIGDIEFYAQNMERLHRQPNIIKFLVFNLTERFPPKKYEDNTCDFDYGFDLFKNRNTYHKQHLMQGFEGVELMTQKLRNGITHKHDKEGRKILKHELKRSVKDPITLTKTFGNMITLCSVLILCGYQFY